MNANDDYDLNESDSKLLDTIRLSSDVSSAFAAISDWGRDRFIESIHSRGDCFERSAILSFSEGDIEILNIPVCRLPATIGSGKKADFKLRADGVSRLHCALETMGNLVRIVDQNSTNGVILNNKRIMQEDLCDGDELKLGAITLRVRKA